MWSNRSADSDFGFRISDFHPTARRAGRPRHKNEGLLGVEFHGRNLRDEKNTMTSRPFTSRYLVDNVPLCAAAVPLCLQLFPGDFSFRLSAADLFHEQDRDRWAGANRRELESHLLLLACLQPAGIERVLSSSTSRLDAAPRLAQQTYACCGSNVWGREGRAWLHRIRRPCRGRRDHRVSQGGVLDRGVSRMRRVDPRMFSRTEFFICP